jgi:transposase
MAINENQENLKIEKFVDKKKNFYSQEFKDQVIGVYKSGVYDSVAACAEAYSLCSRTLHGWLKKYNKKSAPTVVSEQQAENARLKKELVKARMENDILKKAAIYFANQAQ